MYIGCAYVGFINEKFSHNAWNDVEMICINKKFGCKGIRVYCMAIIVC